MRHTGNIVMADKRYGNACLGGRADPRRPPFVHYGQAGCVGRLRHKDIDLLTPFARIVQPACDATQNLDRLCILHLRGRHGFCARPLLINLLFLFLLLFLLLLLLIFPFGPRHQRVVNKRFQQGQQGLFVVAPSKDLKRVFATSTKRAVVCTSDAQRLRQYGRQAERNALRNPQPRPPVEAHRIVYVHHDAGVEVDQDVVQVAVAEANDPPHHAHDSERARKAALLDLPVSGACAAQPQLFLEQPLRSLGAQVLVHAAEHLGGPRCPVRPEQRFGGRLRRGQRGPFHGWGGLLPALGR